MSDINTLKNSRQYRIIQVCGVALTLRSKNKPLLNANLCFCKANDIDKILALQDKAHSAMKQKEWFAYTSRAELEAAFGRGYPAVAVICGEKMIAFAYLILSPDSSQSLCQYADFDILPYFGSDCVLDTVFVDPDFVGYGIQSLLIERLKRIAHENGKTSIWATVHPDNAFSSRNFIKSGFIKANSEPIEKHGGIRDVYCFDFC